MKTSVWDILTLVTLSAILILLAAFGAILLNPDIAFNPFKPPKLVSPLSIPTPTNTMPPKQLPPTWTPSPIADKVIVETVSTLMPSSTPVPSNTPVFLPSFTPTLTLRAGRSGGSCTVIFQNPPDGTVVTADSDVPVRWTLKNTGSTEWLKDSADVKFTLGDRMHLGNDLIDIPYSVSPGSMIDITMDMRAPKNQGVYTSNWSIVQNGASMCNFYIQLRVR
jgi:hypothetical protein